MLLMFYVISVRLGIIGIMGYVMLGVRLGLLLLGWLRLFIIVLL
jgi:hypothetical protein